MCSKVHLQGSQIGKLTRKKGDQLLLQIPPGVLPGSLARLIHPHNSLTKGKLLSWDDCHLQTAT